MFIKHCSIAVIAAIMTISLNPSIGQAQTPNQPFLKWRDNVAMKLWQNNDGFNPKVRQYFLALPTERQELAYKLNLRYCKLVKNGTTASDLRKLIHDDLLTEFAENPARAKIEARLGEYQWEVSTETICKR
jgi:hypothetical protein